MSLDVSLIGKYPQPKPKSSGIFIREEGQTKEISREEWDRRFPDQEPVSFRNHEEETNELYQANITHNLGNMAEAAGIYMPLWRPEEIGITKARQLVEPLRDGLALLNTDPERFKAFNSPNGWGMYEHFVPFVAKYLAACERYPDADVGVSR